jgi:signal transduction histidine kinase
LADWAAIAFGLAVLCLVALLSEPIRQSSPRSLDALAGLLLALAVAALLVRGRFPATVTVAVLGLSVLWYSLGYGSRLIDAPALVAFYTLGTTGHRVRELAVGGLAVGALVAAALAGEGNARAGIGGIGWAAAAILFGELVRSRHLLLVQYAQRAAEAEQERDAEAERRVAGERLRIARDVHDVLAHTVSVMTVQAGVAADAMDRDPGAARSALTRVRSAGKEAATEIRATVAVLRNAPPADADPTPGLDRLPELVEGARGKGLDVELSVDLDGVGVESLVELTAFRIVQESLTNVIRHAGASRARVRVTRSAAHLLVEVRDDGRPPGRAVEAAPGYGLRGMGERVEAVGGTLRYGFAPDGGWSVRASLPTRAAGP